MAQDTFAAPTLPGFVYTAARVAHMHDLQDEMGMNRETPQTAELRAEIERLGGNGAKMVVTVAEHLDYYDPEEYPGVTLIAFASAPAR